MRRLTFLEYVDQKQDETVRQLDLLKRLLKHGGVQVEGHIHKGGKRSGKDIYLYCWSPTPGIEGGCRIYKLGDDINVRWQEEPPGKDEDNGAESRPSGAAVSLPVEDIFQELKSGGDRDNTQVVMELARRLVKRLKEFFRDRQREADRKDISRSQVRTDIVASAVQDYGSMSNTPM